MLALHPEYHIQGEPKSIIRIPNDVVAHADRVLSVKDSIKHSEFCLDSDDPYLSRLSYAKTISSIFTNKKARKKSLWDLCRTVRANIFYLNYVRTYTQRKMFRSNLFRIGERSRSQKLRQLCMTRRRD